ncbi:histidine kinase, partial [Caulobacter sp. D5]
MKRVYGRAAEVVGTIRVRLLLTLTLALLPVLLIGALQSALVFKHEGDARRQSLELAAGRSAAIARARIEAA